MLTRTFALLALCTTFAAAQTPARLDTIAKHYQQQDHFNGQVTLARDGKTIFQQGYGFANVEWQLPFTPDTRFNIGSVSKEFTAAAILLLQQDGKLKTSDTLVSHLAGLPAAWSGVTLRQMLSHTSGLPGDGVIHAQTNLRFTVHPSKDLVTPLLTAPMDFAPGTSFQYNNSNFLLLALVVEQASGQPFCDFLQQRIFAPLALAQTTCTTEPTAVPHHATGYTPQAGGTLAPANTEVPGFYLGYGGLISSAADLVRWTDALHNGRVLNPVSYQEMTTEVRDGYGYALTLGTRLGQRMISHTGAITGYCSSLTYLPGTHTTVVVLSNVLSFDPELDAPGCYALDSELDSLAADPKAILPSEGTELPLPTATLDRYIGRYALFAHPQTAALEVKRQGQHLTLTRTAQPNDTVELRAETTTEFYLVGHDNGIEFEPAATPRGQAKAQFYDIARQTAIPFVRIP